MKSMESSVMSKAKGESLLTGKAGAGSREPSDAAPSGRSGEPNGSKDFKMTPSSEARFVGALDAIVGGTVEGWAVNTDAPGQPVTVEIFDGDLLLGSAVALIFRSDLLAAGFGTGNHHFKFLLPETVLDGKIHLISARPAGHQQELRKSPASFTGSSTDLAGPPPRGPKPEDIAVGMLEVVSDDGWVKGWAWYPSKSDRRVEVELLVDGEIVGRTIAALHRKDLVAAGIGDGNYSFSIALPYEVLIRPRDSLVSVRDGGTQRVFAEPRVFRRPEVADAVEKIASLEDDARLLKSRVEFLADRASADERAAAELFKTVGDFFIELAGATAEGTAPGSMRTLHTAIRDVTSRFPRIELSLPASPSVTFCIEAAGGVENIYNTLRRISEFQSRVRTEVIVFDAGACAEASLLPLVIRNLRYVRLESTCTRASARNQALQLARGTIAIFLSECTAPTADWIDELVSIFAADQSISALSAKIMRSDGILESIGLKVIDGRPKAIGASLESSSTAFANSLAVDAFSGDACAVRIDAWRRAGGLEDSEANLESALVALCGRLVLAGGTVIYEPTFSILKYPH